MQHLIFAAAVSSLSALAAIIVDEEVQIQTEFVRLEIDPAQGGAMSDLGFLSEEHSLAGRDGLLREGFGVGSFYVPNRRLNERLEIDDADPMRPIVRFSYQGDGPNIKGLRVKRTVEPLRDKASIRVVWRIENAGEEAQWIAPWVRNHVTPGGTVGPEDRIDIPTLDGLIQPVHSLFAPASRNWIAATDSTAKETVYAVFDAEDLYAFEAIMEENTLGFGARFVPRFLAPGEIWETTYRLCAIRGLTRVDFATDEFASELSYEAGVIRALISATEAFDRVELHASIIGENGEATALGGKRFSLAPDRLIRASYNWSAPADGVYEFLAQVRKNGTPVALGSDTRSPHGGFDTQFTVGDTQSAPMEAWTDAPYALERGARTLDRTLAAEGDTAIWFESSLNKIFREDVPRALGSVDPEATVVLAQNEHESFQIVLRPKAGQDLHDVAVRVGTLRNRATGAALPASSVQTYRVGYVPVRIPSHLENPTGDYPDILYPFAPFDAPGGRCAPIWVTVFAPQGTRPGHYRGPVEILSADHDPVTLALDVEVLDFALPQRPTLKTDFGFSTQQAHDHAAAMGFTGGAEALDRAYGQNARDHRATLRALASMPAESADYKASLADFSDGLDDLLASGVTTISVPSSLIDIPEQLRAANAFVVKHELQDLVFCHMSAEPLKPAWLRLLDEIGLWRELAPDIPVMVSTFGLEPFLAEDCEIWTVHSQVFDTLANKTILERIAGGREVWWYVNHAPPRPYANFLIELEPLEHRALFWQAWALGVQGLHYSGVNNWPSGQNPFENLLDVTPVNGDGVLLYPGEDGPVNSIRWETIRDGIEDFDYLALLMSRLRKLRDRGGHLALLDRAMDVADLEAIIPNLVTYTRDAVVFQSKRDAMGRMIVELQRALGGRR